MPSPKYDVSEIELKHKKALYLEKEILKLQNINTLLIIVYYILAIIAIYFLYFSYNFTIYLKIPTSLILLILPYFMFTLEEAIIDQILFSKNLLFGNPHEKR